MSQATRDQEAEAVAKAAVLRLFGEEAIDRIEVFPTEDQAGEAGAVRHDLPQGAQGATSRLPSSRHDRRRSRTRCGKSDDFRFPLRDLPRARLRAAPRTTRGPPLEIRHVASRPSIRSTTLACLRPHDKGRPRSGVVAARRVDRLLCGVSGALRDVRRQRWSDGAGRGSVYTPVFRAPDHYRTVQALLQGSVGDHAGLAAPRVRLSRNCWRPANGRTTTPSLARTSKHGQGTRPSPARKR